MHSVKYLIFAIAFLVLALPSMAAAEAPSLSGTYELDEEASDVMVEAFEPAIEAMGRMRRGFARRAIESEDDPSEQIQIATDDDEVVIESVDEPPLTAPLDGETVDYVDGDGDKVRVRARIDDGALVVHNDVEDGEYTTTYRLDDSGDRLEVVSDIDMDQLPKEVTYRLYYDRR